MNRNYQKGRSRELRPEVCQRCGNPVQIVVPVTGIYASGRNQEAWVKEHTKTCPKCETPSRGETCTTSS